MSVALRRSTLLGVSLLSLLAFLAGGCAISGPSGKPSSSDEAQERPKDPGLRTSARPARVIVVGVGGLRAHDYRVPGYDGPASDARAAAGALMPTLAGLAQRGVYADRVRGVVPSTLYPSYATIVTGRLPAEHGVVSDLLMGQTGVRPIPYWHASRLTAPSLWSAARGKGVLSLGWPSTVGAAIDLLVPDILPLASGQSWLEVLEPAATPWLYDLVAARAPGDGRPWPTGAERDRVFIDLACEVAASDVDPALSLIYLNDLAEARGVAGLGSVGARDAARRVDGLLADLLSCLRAAGRLDDAAIVVTGGEDLRPVHTWVDPNVALVGASLIGRDPRVESGIRTWLAITRSNGGSAFVYAEDAQAALSARDVLTAEAKRTGGFRVVPAQELAPLAVDPQAWFGLAAEPGYVIGNGVDQPSLRPSPLRASAGYLPRQASRRPTSGIGFVAWGHGFRQGIRFPELDLVDIAPTVAELLEVTLGDVPGTRLVGALDAELVMPRPVSLPRHGESRGDAGSLDRLEHRRIGGAKRPEEDGR